MSALPTTQERQDEWVELARAICAETSTSAAQHRLTTAAQTFGADAAGLTLLGTHRFLTAAPTNELPAMVDVLQYEFGGPCVAALLDSVPQVLVDDLRTDTRWPEFAAAAAQQTPVRSMLSCRLYLQAEEPLGSLNLYGRIPHAFNPDTARTIAQLIVHTAPALALVAERERATNLQASLDSSRMIGIAMGVLMTQRAINAAQAFELLCSSSQRTNRKLRDVAAHVAETGELESHRTGDVNPEHASPKAQPVRKTTGSQPEVGLVDPLRGSGHAAVFEEAET